ncbi:UNVERIFIED_CONTAM: Guard cell S-type anion channel SLAC1 [Sesamum latifolium]|uniref:Guard cell S-type anion channel SLAC1 n=1 Tax=Sesamum latifolium TaxID=2727402 RepID=A0AAW2XJI5_9LAMI
MEMRETSRRSPATHFVDIHEVPEVEEEEDEEHEENKPTRTAEKQEKRFNKAIKAREVKKPNRNFSRQVSLETGFSVLNGDKRERKALPRSGKSFGGFGSAYPTGAEVRKGDFSIFKTKSNLVKQNSKLPLRKESGIDLQYNDVSGGVDESVNESVPAGRYFAALRGPELDEVKESEDILLPKDEKWPFLLRFPLVALSQLLLCPVVVCMFLAIGVPSSIAPNTLHPAVWCTFMAPIVFLDLKIYGQWLSGGKRRLCKVANPSSHLSVVGNFVGAILAAKVGWAEAGKFLWAIGFAHYLVVFVTLYQRLPTSEALPKELHPVYSMFIATPAAASIAWGAIYDEFDGLSRTCYFIALFLYCSLIVRINFFRGFRFSVAWWSYTFPMTTASIATIKYAEQVPSVVSKGLALSLSFMSSTIVSILLVSTLLHAFVWKTLFPNDLAIAITKRRQGKEKKPLKKVYDIRRWTKQSPLAFVSNIGKHNSAEHNSTDKDNEVHK